MSSHHSADGTFVPVGTVTRNAALVASSPLMQLAKEPKQAHPNIKTDAMFPAKAFDALIALVLGLVVSSAASSYFAQRDELNQISAKFVFLDRILAQYGPAAEQARHALRELVAGVLDRFWPEEHMGEPTSTAAAGGR